MFHDINIKSMGTFGRGETYWDREIPKELYDRAVSAGGRFIKDDEEKVLTMSEKWGYGASCGSVFEQGGKYYVHCHRYNNCD